MRSPLLEDTLDPVPEVREPRLPRLHVVGALLGLVVHAACIDLGPFHGTGLSHMSVADQVVGSAGMIPIPDRRVQ